MLMAYACSRDPKVQLAHKQSACEACPTDLYIVCNCSFVFGGGGEKSQEDNDETPYRLYA